MSTINVYQILGDLEANKLKV